MRGEVATRGVPRWIRVARRIGFARPIVRDPSWAEGSVLVKRALAGACADLWREGRELVSSCTSTGGVVWSCRSKGEGIGRANGRGGNRSAARDAGFVNPPDAGAGSAARMGYFGTHSPGIEQGATGAARVAVPGAAPAGAARMDQGAVGRVVRTTARRNITS